MSSIPSMDLTPPAQRTVPDSTIPADGQDADLERRGVPACGPDPADEKNVAARQTPYSTPSAPDASALQAISPSEDTILRAEASRADNTVAAKAPDKRKPPVPPEESKAGVLGNHALIRDERSDLSFTGTLLASAADAATCAESTREYRVYETAGGKHVFSRAERGGNDQSQHRHDAVVFDPSTSVSPERLLQNVRDGVGTIPLTWKQAAIEFFGYDVLAKELYRKLGAGFEEHID